MTEEFELEMSPLSQPITVDGKNVQVDIYRGDKGGWMLEVIDESNSSLVWDDEFETDAAALDEVKRTTASGVMVVALNQQATQHLNHQFQVGTVQKRYLAILEGWVKDDEGVISAPIAKDKSQFPRVKICSSTGKAATSHFRVLDRLTQPQRTLVEFTPVTGRTHQLRIHSLFMGHPILGCDLYHSATSQQLADRLLLHASDLYFQHPLTGEPCHGHCTSPF